MRANIQGTDWAKDFAAEHDRNGIGTIDCLDRQDEEVGHIREDV